MAIIGIDNGVTGAIAVLSSDHSFLKAMPVTKSIDYTKKVKYVSRVNHLELFGLLNGLQGRAYLERPMVNPGRFAATASALRAFEATLIVLEQCGISYQFIDSKEWQKALLPDGLKGPQLKEASLLKAIQLFPHLEKEIRKQKDGDALLIAEYARLKL
jgi:hypothetical protein